MIRDKITGNFGMYFISGPSSFFHFPKGKIQALKHSIPKGDKKRKKQVTIEIAQLQAELDQKQQNEIYAEVRKLQIIVLAL